VFYEQMTSFSMYFQNYIPYKTYISDFSYSKNQWNGAVLYLIYRTTLVHTLMKSRWANIHCYIYAPPSKRLLHKHFSSS